MDKVKARKMFELADRLSKVNASELTEQQLSERNSMIARLQEEMSKLRETPGIKTSVVHKGSYGTSYDSGRDDEDDEELGYFKQDTKGSRGPLVRPNTQGRSPSQWSGKTPARIPFDEAGIEPADNTPSQGTHYNVNKLGGEIGVDPRVLRTAIQRSMLGNPTRQDTLTLADAFLAILKNGDDQTIQRIANLIKSGNPREIPQESTAAIAERNAFVDAMRQVKKGEKFNVGGKEFTKTTNHGTMDKEEVKEEINTEAYDRLRKVFDFSNYKG